ncbi:MAG: hypothetical protein AAF483_00765 [Planctomycetota bacterium]
MVKIDEYAIDELVCGNLRGEEYRRVLQALDEQPGAWKACALAFLQEQALTQELESLAANDRIWSDDSETSIAPTVELASKQDAAQRKEKVRLEWMTRVTSIAALLLVSFTIGWFGAGMRPTTTTTAPDPGDLVNNNDSLPQGDSSSADPVLTQYVVDGEIIPFNRTTPELLQRLKESGNYDIESYDRIISLRDGESIRLVPMQQHRVRSKLIPY